MRRRDEHGAIAMLTAILMVILLGVAAFVVDIGMQRVARRDMQALADIVALDLSRLIDGRDAGLVENPSLAEARQASVERNDHDVVGDELNVEARFITIVGRSEGRLKVRETRPNEKPDGVEVIASTDVAFGFAGALPGGPASGGVTSSAIATSQFASACFHLGSYAATVAGSGDLADELEELLLLGISPPEYPVLAATALSLDELAEQTVIGSVERLFEGPLTLDALAEAAVRALPAGHRAVVVLNRIRASDGSGRAVALGDAVAIDPSDTEALATPISILDVLADALLGAQGSTAIDDGPLSLVQQAQRVCGSDGAAAVGSALVADPDQDAADLEAETRGLAITGPLTLEGGIGGVGAELTTADECDARDYGVVLDNGAPGLTVQVVLTIDGTVTPRRPRQPQIEFDSVELIVRALTPAQAPADVRVDVAVPRSAVNNDPDRDGTIEFGTAQRPGQDFATIPAPEIDRSTSYDEGSIIVTPAAVGDEEAVAEDDVPLNDPRLDRIVRRINREVRQEANAAVLDGVNATIESASDLVGLRDGGALLYGENSPSCGGRRLAG